MKVLTAVVLATGTAGFTVVGEQGAGGSLVIQIVGRAVGAA